MNNIEKIADFIAKCDNKDFIKALIWYEKDYLFEDSNLTNEQKAEVLDNAYNAIMANSQASLLGDEHSEIIDEVLTKYLEENSEQTKKRQRTR
ncbi:hypothetical protein [Campylobacter sp. RM16187]|uniref:hypothetical protein n=1 Tax=Campylobacter sp. RM16187 TaxID=1660063 RepID=UPI0021B5E4AF|nr:hypothetical protein [Campylobacter sp. RM16187]QKG30292.1 hypothetical protein CDOMF_a043 [Campylobacter sp. RM16187]